jgi:hypothetical protein
MPRDLSDFFVFAMDLLESCERSLGFVHTWFIMQVRGLLEAGQPLNSYRVEALARTIGRHKNNSTLSDALLAAWDDLRDRPLAVLQEELLARAEEMESPYHRGRAYIAFARSLPQRRGELINRTEVLLPEIPDPLNRGIIGALLASATSDPQQRVTFRRRAMTEVEVLGEQASLFRLLSISAT